MEIMEEEQKYLEYTLDVIDKELRKSKEKEAQLRKEALSLTFEDKKRGAHFNVNAVLAVYEKMINSLTRSIPKPYFGRFDFVSDLSSKPIKYYIGRNGISSDNNLVVIDWRAPIATLYYDSEVGSTNYLSPQGLINGELTLKRQININNSKLIDVQDTSLVTEDELLKPYLSVNADNKMKIIVASIQKEQNTIIRKPYNANLIVQGVAGSGKTSVALHRIAYLIYNLGDKVSSNQFLVLGPNNYFLNYVSSILPELETSPVVQQTLLKFTSEYINDKISLVEDNNVNHNISAFKSSLQYKEVLDVFLKNYLRRYLVQNDFIIDDEIVFTKEEIMDSLFDNEINDYPNFERTSNYLLNKFKNEKDKLYNKFNQKYRDIYISLPKGDPIREKAITDSNNLYEKLNKNGEKLLKKYLKGLMKKPIDIYKAFISSLAEFNLPLMNEDIQSLQEKTLQNLKKKKVTFEDLPALIHITYKYMGNTSNYKYIVIDEAQDYGLFHFDAIKEIAPDSVFSIYGDLAQSIYSYRSIQKWEDVVSRVFSDNCELLKLNKGYRTTIEVTNNANIILDNMNLNKAIPVIRHGVEIEYQNKTNDIIYKVNKIKELQSKKYKTIAIICKDDKEAKKVNTELTQNGIHSKLISSKDQEYSGGIFVLTSMASKGLEFDAVIINDASEKKYSSLSDVDGHLLYVASTRALHQQVILFNTELTKFYEPNFLKKEKQLVKSK